MCSRQGDECKQAGGTISKMPDENLRGAVLNRAIFNAEDPQIKQDIIRTLIQYLQDEGYHNSATTVQDESNVKQKHLASKKSQIRRMKQAILHGDWMDVERLLTRTTFKNMTAFKYAIRKQQYLELIDSQELHNAFNILIQKLKPLERYAKSNNEFKDLCYLLTCKSVTDVNSFKDWDGIAIARSILIQQYGRLLLDFDMDSGNNNNNPSKNNHVAISSFAGSNIENNEKEVPPTRLINLLQQALAFQISCCSSSNSYSSASSSTSSSASASASAPRIGSILQDYEPSIIPNKRLSSCIGHSSAVKAVTFIGEEGNKLASGSSDNSVKIWETKTGKCLKTLKGHQARIWDITSTLNGSLIASASGDGSIQIYNNDNNNNNENVNKNSIFVNKKDIYTIKFHSLGESLICGGYDRELKLYDINSNKQIKSYTGHISAITSVDFNVRGNMLVSGSKDTSIKFWDVLSGLCVRTCSNIHLGEITSVELSKCGMFLLSGSKDNSNRLWDVRMMNKCLMKFKGHQNTSKNFIRVIYGPKENVIVGGSEDGTVYLWDRFSGDVIGKLHQTSIGQGGPVYRACWNSRQGILASCGHDGIVSTWYCER